MASSRLQLLFFVLFHAILLLADLVKCDDKEDKVLDGINAYRTSLNLPALKENDNAGCLADEIANQLKDQPCTNSTGANTVPGTEPRFANYPDLLSKCNLNITNTRDGVIMPVCVPDLDSSLVVSNFTKSQYSRDLNNSKYTGAGLGSEDNWMVVVLTTNTTGGNFVSTNAAGLASKFGLIFHLLVLLLSSSMF